MDNRILIPDGYTARIEGNEVIFEPKENEDEAIRKRIILRLQYDLEHNSNKFTKRDIPEEIAYLEKLKKPKIDIDKLRKDIYQSGYDDGYRHGKEDARKNAQFVNNFF